MKYIHRWRMAFHIDWRDSDDKSFTEYKIIDDVGLNHIKEIEWYLEGLEEERNKDENNFHNEDEWLVRAIENNDK